VQHRDVTLTTLLFGRLTSFESCGWLRPQVTVARALRRFRSKKCVQQPSRSKRGKAGAPRAARTAVDHGVREKLHRWVMGACGHMERWIRLDRGMNTTRKPQLGPLIRHSMLELIR
jgi:hypothetical protein